MNIFSKILESRPRRKKRERKHRVKNETRTIFSPSSSLSLSLFLVPVFIPIREKNLAQFLIRQRNYSSEKVFDARYTNQARKLGALAMHDISLDRILDRWSLVGTDVAWRSPLPDGETWVSGWTATCETWKEEETMRNRESRTAELRRSLTRNLNYSLRENVSTSIVSSNTRRSFATIPLCDIFHPLLHRTKKTSESNGVSCNCNLLINFTLEGGIVIVKKYISINKFRINNSCEERWIGIHGECLLIENAIRDIENEGII